MTTQRIRGRKLQAMRKRLLQEQPLCVRCLERGRVREATQRDHIIALTNGGDDDGPVQALCAACHRQKTAEDCGYRERVQVGADGYPIDEPTGGNSKQNQRLTGNTRRWLALSGTPEA